MNRDKLFLLAPGFENQNHRNNEFLGDNSLSDNSKSAEAGQRSRREYCPECAEVWGLLSYYPAIKESLNIYYQDINRPRKEMVATLGLENQNCPTLVLDEQSPEHPNCGIQVINDKRFIDNARDIGKYYAARFGTPMPRGS